MKSRESGMPAQDYWESLLNVQLILDQFGFHSDSMDVAELGCGYGTFTVPLAARIRGWVYGYDIEPEMVDTTQRRAFATGLTNVRAVLRDVLEHGFDLPDEACDAVLLFNILHGESPVAMLRESARIVRPGGLLAIIHWRSDIATPRGPPADIRPPPTQISQWASIAGSLITEGASFVLPPWHYGVKLLKV